ncbi:MAG: Eco57I restriction-modification methylase domain-containing protein [Candidatus Brocadia sp.]|nr:MAG: Eco57I restriction-modification methylase domain-containing protein [Candidatus Brocadia sp.]
MDKHQAQNIIKETFESAFDKERFVGFIKNLLKRIEESSFIYQGQFIPDAYKSYISSLERIGKFNDGENRIDILIVKLQKETSLERARTMQRNFIAWYLNGSRGGELKDAALVAFVSPDTTYWRFSLVKMDYKFEQTPTGRTKAKEEFTPARRWSFLVGANENSHTAQSRLVDILANDEHRPTLAELEQAFDIETVTREFFIKYRELFIRTKEELDKIVAKASSLQNEFKSKGVDTVNFAKKLLGQIVFLYFLQKKGWFGVGRDAEWGTGSKHFLRELFEKKVTQASSLRSINTDHNQDACDTTNFFNDILEPLFYEALRIDRSHDDHYYSRFNCKIPFLNGGLFDPIGSNGGYDWVHIDICLPDSLFSNKNKTKEGDIGDGILDIFDRYNFTVREDEPMEKEVAIDPELLGKAYEKFNAIRPDNFEEYKKALKSGKKGEESKFNKQYGVYYTPREIVHYMCQQSLINHLHTELTDSNSNSDRVSNPVRVKSKNGIASNQILGGKQLSIFAKEDKQRQLDLRIDPNPDRVSNPVRVNKVSKEDIETLIHVGEQVGENEEIALIKEQKILEGKQKSSDYKLKLPESIRRNAALIDQKLADITVCDPAVGSGAFPVGMMSEIVKARNALTPFIVTQASLSACGDVQRGSLSPETLSGLKSDTSRTAYDFKRQCIEKSLYGVDIDPGAVEIAKLRLWLSLVVDEDDIKNIKPLPNLDYRIMQGNSLISEFMGINFDADTGRKSDSMLIKDEADELIKQFQEKKDEFLNESNVSRKTKLKEDVDNLLVEIFETKLKIQKADYFSRLREIERKHLSWPTAKERDECIKQDKEKLYKESGFNLESAEKQLKEFTSGRKIKPFFLWKLYFSEVFHEKGGFNIVIANPPYIRAEELGDLKIYLKAAYSLFAPGGDIFSYFYEKSFNILKNEGVFCFINNAFDKTTAGKILREYVAENCSLKKYVDFKSVGVFEGTTTYPIILLATKSRPQETFEYLKVTEDTLRKFNFGGDIVYTPLPRLALKQPSWNFDYQGQAELSEKITKHKKLREVFDKCYYGVKTALNDAFVTEKDLGNSKNLKPVFEGKDIKKWLTPSIGKKMIVFENKSTRKIYAGQDEAKAFEAMQKAFPMFMKHLEPFAEAAKKRYDKGEYWWELRNCAYYDLFRKPKIIFPNLQSSNKFAYDTSGTYLNAPAVFLPTDAKWLLGLLNSKVVWYFLNMICVVRSGGFIEVKPQYFEQIPIPALKDTGKKQLDSLVDQILAAKQKDPDADTSALEKQIDQFVYKLYGLTEDEITTIEGGK